MNATERLPWLTPTLFDQMEREEQSLCVVYAVERRRQDLEDLTHAMTNAFTKVLAMAFGKSEDESGGTIFIGHDPKVATDSPKTQARTRAKTGATDGRS